MTDDKYRPVSLIWLIVIAVLIVFFINTSWATYPDVEQNNTEKSTAWGIGGSDADINDCRFTEGGLTIQWTRKDKFCQAMELIRLGYVDTGVLAICTKTWIGELYNDLAACQAAMVQKYAPVVVEETVDDDDEDYHEEIEQAQQAYANNLAELESRVASVESRRQTAQVTREIIQQPFLSDEKRAKLQAVLDE